MVVVGKVVVEGCRETIGLQLEEDEDFCTYRRFWGGERDEERERICRVKADLMAGVKGRRGELQRQRRKIDRQKE